MKNTKIFALLFAVVMLFVACEPSPGGKKDENAIAKEWHIENWNNQTPEFDVYVSFNEDGTFDLYQQVYTLNYVHYSGTYTAVDTILSGFYADGKPWECSYNYSVSADGSQLTLNSQETIPVTSVYVNEVIPEAVKSEATRVEAIDVVPFL